ncbi:hypothetical protein [Streptomyces sp. NBC_00038]|uniref:hypothetical protein n=1 Tax=unclassified Streptomyces TaxID=2593676 RepID=UPI0022597C5C|nr:hypothetical protein [Streptomyces sp. NBC_00038]MCX5560753.1 hypothetical protein [Streptomyces sp. NBC_00038]WUC14055.1 hypothetical protein OG256_31180 [Streptomyces sp. NBC_00564]
MCNEQWSEFDPIERDDANRLGYLFEGLQNHLHFHPVIDDFIAVLGSALDAEFIHRAWGTYPPQGHGYPRLEP